MIATWHRQTISIASYNTKSDRPAHAGINMARYPHTRNPQQRGSHKDNKQDNERDK